MNPSGQAYLGNDGFMCTLIFSLCLGTSGELLGYLENVRKEILL